MGVFWVVGGRSEKKVKKSQAGSCGELRAIGWPGPKELTTGRDLRALKALHFVPWGHGGGSRSGRTQAHALPRNEGLAPSLANLRFYLSDMLIYPGIQGRIQPYANA